MVDFAKLRDPEWQAKHRAEREAEQAKLEAHEKKLRAAVELGLQVDESLTEAERSLVRNCRMRLNTFQHVTEKQEKWLLDIAARMRKVQVDRFAGGDENGEHPSYARIAWPHAGEFDSDSNAYWAWVLHQIMCNGGDEEHCSECGAQLNGDSWDGKCGSCVDQYGDKEAI
jgi:hypothetical protein